VPKGATQQPRPTGWRLVGPTTAAAACALAGWQLGAVGVGMTVAAMLVALVSLPRHARPQEHESDEALRAHLARARRRGEPTDVLVVRLAESSPSVARRLKDSLRVTDSSYLLWDGAAFELRAMVDRERLDRRALEARLRSVAAGPLELGWARFPEDGYTLSVLLGEARRDCRLAERGEAAALHSPVAPVEPLNGQAAQRALTGPWPQEVASR
jgi:hypothetical protein